MIRAVVFDFGGVVVSEGWANWIREYIPDEKAIHEELMQVGPQVDRGIIPASGYTDLFAKVTGKSSQEVNTEILLTYELHNDVIEIIKKLQETTKIGLIANFPTEWFDYLIKKFQLEQYFDSVRVSGQIHIVKPEAKIYAEVLEDVRVAPEEAVFVDDNLPNILGAKDIGMRGVHFTDTQSLIHDLKQLGLPL